MQIGKRIRLLRVEKELSQDNLGNLVGLTQAQISQIESSKSDPDTELIRKIAKALGVSPVVFFEDEEPEPKQKPKARVHFGMPGHLTEDEQEKIIELVEKLGNAQTNDRELVLQLVDKILKK